MNGRVLTIHLVEGTANGLQTAEVDNWIGKVFVAPRTDLPTLLQQVDLQGLGVYVLIGDDPNQLNKSIIYIGQGAVANRLNAHSSSNDKAFWDNKTLVIVAKDKSLTSTDCLYLESRLIELANNAKSSTLTNGQYPPLPNLTAPAKDTVENFLAQIQVLLPVLNINFFVVPPNLSQPPSTILLTPQAEQGLSLMAFPAFSLVTGTVQAEAEQVNNKFVVHRGSLASASETPGLGVYYSALRKQLKDDGKLVDNSESGKWTFGQDVEFNSPSAAAAVICGHNVSGPATWKVKNTNQTYGVWLQAQVSAVSPKLAEKAQREKDIDNDNPAAYMTLTKLDGTAIGPGGVTLPDGTKMSRQEYYAWQDAQDAADKAFNEAMYAEAMHGDESKC